MRSFKTRVLVEKRNGPTTESLDLPTFTGLGNEELVRKAKRAASEVGGERGDSGDQKEVKKMF